MKNNCCVLVGILILVTPGAFAASFPIDDSQMEQLHNYQQQALSIVDGWTTPLAQYQAQYQAKYSDKKTSENIDWAIDKVQCIKAKIEKGFRFEMTETKAGAQTFPIFGSTIQINQKFFSEDMGYNEKYRVASIIHEASHKCGTTDAAYFRQGVKPHSTLLIPWSMIADTYQYWATYGICLPDIDC